MKICAKTVKPANQDIPAFAYRQKTIHEWYNKCRGEVGKIFKKRYPTAEHYLYSRSTFWLWYDLLLRSDEERKQVNFIKHWEMAQVIDHAIEACNELHSLAGEVEKINNYKKPDHYLLEVSRDTFKSTLCRAGLIRTMGVYPGWTNAYIRSRSEDAYDSLRFITSHLLNNSELHKYFPKLKIDRKEIKRKQLQFGRKAIDLAIDVEAGETEVEYAIKRTYDPDPTLQAIGLDEAYTGKHKHGLIVIDDCVTEKNYGSKAIQDRIAGRLAEMSIVASWQCIFIFSQTPYIEYDAYNRRKNTLRMLQEEEDKIGSGVKIYEHYYQPIFELKDKNGNQIDPEILLNYNLHPKNAIEKELGKQSIVFPERHNPRKIKRMYYDSPSPRFFYSQFLLKMIPDSERFFKDEWLTFYGENTPVGRQPDRKNLRIIVIIDPSGAAENKSDEAGILVTGIDSDSFIWMLEAMERRLTDKGLMDLICGLHDVYRPDEWYMEAFATENKYKNLIQQILNYQGYSISIQAIRGKQTAGAKYDRIESSRLPFEMRRIYVNEKHADFLKQYAEWRRPTPAGCPDHILDALGYLTQMIFPMTGDYDGGYGEQFIKRELDSAFDLPKYEIQAIRKRQQQEAKHQKVLCPSCYELRAATDEVCVECGSELMICLAPAQAHFVGN